MVQKKTPKKNVKMVKKVTKVATKTKEDKKPAATQKTKKAAVSKVVKKTVAKKEIKKAPDKNVGKKKVSKKPTTKAVKSKIDENVDVAPPIQKLIKKTAQDTSRDKIGLPPKELSNKKRPSEKKEKQIEAKENLHPSAHGQHIETNRETKADHSFKKSAKQEDELETLPIHTKDKHEKFATESKTDKKAKKGSPKAAAVSPKAKDLEIPIDDEDFDFEDDFADDDELGQNDDLDELEDEMDGDLEGVSAHKAREDEEDEDDDDFELDEKVMQQKGARELGERIMEEVAALSEDYKLSDIRDAIKEIDFFAATETDECREKFCENLATTLGFCRFHYIKHWKSIRKKRAILAEGKLQLYIEELIQKYPTKYIEAIMKDLSGDKEFYNALKDLNIDTSYQYDEGSSDYDLDDDIAVETKGYGIGKAAFDEDELV